MGTNTNAEETMLGNGSLPWVTFYPHKRASVDAE